MASHFTQNKIQTPYRGLVSGPSLLFYFSFSRICSTHLASLQPHESFCSLKEANSNLSAFALIVHLPGTLLPLGSYSAERCPLLTVFPNLVSSTPAISWVSITRTCFLHFTFHYLKLAFFLFPFYIVICLSPLEYKFIEARSPVCLTHSGSPQCLAYMKCLINNKSMINRG